MATLPQPADPTLEIISRKDARNRGLKRFFTGIPCKRGHLAQRYVSTCGCIVCVSDKRNAWVQDHREWERDYNYEWKKKNPDKVREWSKKYWEKNGDKLNDKRRGLRKSDENCRNNYNKQSMKYKVRNIEAVTAANAKYRARPENREKAKIKSREWYAENRERAWAANKEWRINNPKEAASLRCAQAQRRRARLAGASGSFTKDDVARLLDEQGCKCAACMKDVTSKYDVDHIVPLSRGGSNSPNNLQILCPSCNRSKGALLPEEWVNSKRSKWLPSR